MAELSPEEMGKLAADYYAGLNTDTRELAKGYADAKTKNKAAAEKAYEKYITALGVLKNGSYESFEEVKRAALALSRRSDSGNADELNMDGGIYGTAGSDASTAQIIHDAALGNSLNLVSAAQSNAAAESELNARLAEYEAQTHILNNASEIEKSYIENQTREDSSSAGAGLKKYRAMQDALGDYYDSVGAAESFEYQKQSDAFANAIKEVKTFGRVISKASSDALGVPIGTRKYKSGSSGSGKQSEAYKSALKDAKSMMAMDVHSESAEFYADQLGVSPQEVPARKTRAFIDGLKKDKTITAAEYKKLYDVLGLN